MTHFKIKLTLALALLSAVGLAKHIGSHMNSLQNEMSHSELLSIGQDPEPLTVLGRYARHLTSSSNTVRQKETGAGTKSVIKGVERKLPESNLPWVVRSRGVEISNEITKILGALPKDDAALEDMTVAQRSFEVELFSDRSATVVVEKVRSSMDNGFIVRGKVDGYKDSRINLVQENGITFADVYIEDKVYEIRPTKAGHIITEVDASKMETHHSEPLDMSDKGDSDSEAHLQSGAFSKGLVAAADASEQTIAVIDVLIGFTPWVKTEVGSDAGIKAMGQLLIDKANESFEMSKIYQRVRLVGFWAADTDTDYDDDQRMLITRNDGKWDSVFAARDAAGADMVQLVTPNLIGSCGQGTIHAQNADQSMNVVDYLCISTHSGTHEMGHNFGAKHNRENAGSSVAIGLSYAHGYIDYNQCFKDVMAYPRGCATARFPFFSSSDRTLLHNGYPTGTPTEDNARALNERRLTVANFMPTIVADGAPLVVPQPVVSPPPVVPADCHLKLVSPNGGESLSHEQNVILTYTGYNSNVGLEPLLMKNGSIQRGLVNNHTPDGRPYFTVPASDIVAAGSNYKIRVRLRDNPACWDESDGFIGIGAPAGSPAPVPTPPTPPSPTPPVPQPPAPPVPTPPGSCSIKILSPNGGETLKTSVTYTLEYTAANAGVIQAQLFRNGKQLKSISLTTVNGKLQFKFPADYSGTGYKLQLKSKAINSCFDDSDGSFSLSR